MAYSFDSDDAFVNTSWNSPASNTFTVGCRMNADPSIFFALACNQRETIGGMFLLCVAGGGGQLYISQGGGGTPAGAPATSAMSGAGSYALVGVADGSNFRVYVDGVAGSDVAYDGTLLQSTDGMTLGVVPNDTLTGARGSFPGWLVGTLSEVFVSSVAWTAAEIMAFNNYSPLVIRRGVVSYWPLIREKQDIMTTSTLSVLAGSPTVAAHSRMFYPTRFAK